MPTRSHLASTDIPPESGAIAMGLGILATASRAAGAETLSAILLACAGAVWIFLARALWWRWIGDRELWRAQGTRPGALTSVAATGVLGAGLCSRGWLVAAWCCLALATVLWCALLPRVLRAAWSGPRLPGAAFLLCVSTQSLSVLCGQLAVTGSAALLVPAGFANALGVLLYGFVLARFDFRQLTTGPGDHWVAGGALAISCVASATLTSALSAHVPGWCPLPRVLDLVLLAVTALWYLALGAAEIRAPRRNYHLRRWATVFPLGMICVAGFTSATATGLPWLTTVATIALLPALGVAALTAWGTARTIIGAVRPR